MDRDDAARHRRDAGQGMLIRAVTSVTDSRASGPASPIRRLLREVTKLHPFGRLKFFSPERPGLTRRRQLASLKR